jgi:hypothetical protein
VSAATPYLRLAYLQDDVEFTAGAWDLGRYEVFGFLAGGTLSHIITVVPPGQLPSSGPTPFMWSMLCTDDQMDSIFDMDSKNDVCNANLTQIWYVREPISVRCFTGKRKQALNPTSPAQPTPYLPMQFCRGPAGPHS